MQCKRSFLNVFGKVGLVSRVPSRVSGDPSRSDSAAICEGIRSRSKVSSLSGGWGKVRSASPSSGSKAVGSTCGDE
jgi:hypothetical protein